ncbi:Josephin-domain-containing protein [Thelephora terrestris]|uniref:ubiquitinyl hydrolase 1 n=1 Tax=Thelephora terrestris TaxID=56493 RepID=A0A9P6HCK7_9AGAM|nr:Josephin-domain-containing protein [Thelephora terrestris]
MSTLSQLVPLIYHERQEKGSMLCAQHALNNLLQEHCFSVPDLSTIARGLDELEESYNEGRRGRRSSNMDDTGFFSLQVLQKALEVWSLSLISWRSEEMSAYTSHPHTQLAFILNLNEHWFTLRRFGAAPTDVDDPDPGQGHWFNLDSFLRKPEWVGSLYLSMVLQQSEQDGYSVFAVKRSDPSQTAALRETEADTLAARLPDPNNGTSSLAVGTSQALFPHAPELQAALEDRELQAALQASLMSGLASSRRGSNLASPASIPNVTGPEVVPDLDPVAASVARNRVIMERMRREQEMALRDTYEDVDMEEVSRRSREAQEEDMMLRRAIEESEKLAKEEGKKQQDHQDQQPHAGESSSTSPTHISSSLRDDRVYDDEDEELQAALRASLQDAPSGYQPQPFPPPSRRRIPEGLTLSRKQTLAPDSETQSTEGETEPESGSEMEGSFDESKEEQVSMEEMRKRRLARFGG